VRERLLRMVENEDVEGIKSLLSGRIPDVDLEAILDAVRRDKERAKTLVSLLNIEDFRVPAEGVRMRLRLLPPKRKNPKKGVGDLLARGLMVGATLAFVVGVLDNLINWVRNMDKEEDEEELIV